MSEIQGTPRDTQFAGFAKLLWVELEQAIRANQNFIPEGKKMRSVFIPMIEKRIAQRAYDLVEYAIFSIDQEALTPYRDEIVQKTPDLVIWPENVEWR